MINTLRKIAEFVDAQNQIAEIQTDLEANGDAIDNANTDITTLNIAVNSLDSRIDAYDALAPFVRKNQSAAWTAATGTEARTALASYAGQTVSNPPTQVEVQTIDDALKAHSQHVVALINDLKVDVLT